MQSKSIIEVASKINRFYMQKGFIDPSEYVLTLYLICLYREHVILKEEGFDSLSLKIISNVSFKSNSELEKIQPFFSVLNYFNTEEIKSILEDFSKIDNEDYKYNFPEIFDVIFRYITDSNSYKNGAFVIQPKMVNLIMNVAEMYDYQNVYNPFASNASFPVTLKDNVTYFGQEYNEQIWRIGKLRLYAYSKNENFTYSLESSLENWATDKKFDLIFSRLPLLNTINVKDDDGSQIDLENFMIKKSLQCVADEGKVIFLLKPSFLSSSKSKNKELFKNLIDQNLVEKIMIFPNGVFRHTQISINAIVLNKNKLSENIQFIDLTNFLEVSRTRKLNVDWENVEYSNHLFTPWNSVSVTKDTIKKNDYDLYGKQYFLENIDGVALKDLVEISNGKRAENNDINIIINISDLSDDPIKTKFNSDLSNQSEMIFDKNKYCVIDDEGVLVSLVGGKLKPTLFDGKNASLISSHIVQLKIKSDKVLLYKYLAKELSEDYVLKQVEAFSTGEVQIVISRIKLGEIIIKVPPLEIQKKELEKLYGDVILRLSEDYELTTEDLKKSWEANIIENKALLRHKIAGPVSNLEFYSDSINKILVEKILPNYPDLFSFKLNENQILNLGQLLTNLTKDTRKISNELKNHTDEFNVFEYVLVEIDIYVWMENFADNIKERYKNVEFVFNFDKNITADKGLILLKVNANEDLLSILFDNLISNVLKHGFTWTDSENRRIEIDIAVDNEDNIINIFVSNTGNPFPQNFTQGDFHMKGVKKGKNGGDGIGGYLITSIINYFSGTWFIVDETGSDGLTDTDLVTTFEISLPYHL